jgi:Zn-dependent protease
MLEKLLIFAPPLIVAVVLHEIAHGYVAYLLGDPTAKKLGRLSLNPIRHVDPFMTLILPGLLVLAQSPVLFGGAKPVPINPFYFKNPRYGIVLVAIAGPLTNLTLALLSFGAVVGINRFSLLQELIPAPLLLLILMWCLTGVITNLVLALFNLIPIPPLDGGKIAVGLLPKALAVLLAKLESWGLLLLFLLLSSGSVSAYLSPAITFATKRLCSELYAGDTASCPILGGYMRSAPTVPEPSSKESDENLLESDPSGSRRGLPDEEPVSNKPVRET